MEGKEEMKARTGLEEGCSTRVAKEEHIAETQEQRLERDKGVSWANI